MERIKDFPGKSKPISITFDGKRIEAFEHETVGMAMLAEGKRTLARSIKYHRPRGMFCSTGTCQRCLVEIDGKPNRRACSTLVKEGMIVRSQNAVPNAERDFLSILDKFSNYLPASVYHHHFLEPKFLRQTYLKILKRFTGLGRLYIKKRTLVDTPSLRQHPLKKLSVEVTIVGGKLTGLSAALSAADAGASVVILDEKDSLNKPSFKEVYGGDTLDDNFLRYRSKLIDLETQVRGHTKIKFLEEAFLAGIYEGNHLGVFLDGAGIADLQTEGLILATGAYDALPIFRNNELPGIFSARLVNKMVYDYGVKPGKRALIWGSTKLAREVAQALNRAEMEIAGFVTAASVVSRELSLMAEDLEVEVWTNSCIADVKGKKMIKSAKIQDMQDGRYRKVKCDTIILCHSQPRYELQVQAGCDMIFDEQRGGLVAKVDEILRSSQPWVCVAGEALGSEKGHDLCIAEGRLAGYVAARDIGYHDSTPLEDLIREVNKFRKQSETEPMPTRLEDDQGYVCVCQDVKAKELLYEKKKLDKEKLKDFHAELLKRRTGILTGACQGKMCLSNLLRVIAIKEGKNPLQYPIPTVRPPIKPIRIKDMSLGEKHGENGV